MHAQRHRIPLNMVDLADQTQIPICSFHSQVCGPHAALTDMVRDMVLHPS